MPIALSSLRAVIDDSRISTLAELHAMTDQLHGTFDRRHVLQTIQRIATRLSGSDELAIFELDTAGQRLVPTAASGIEASGFESIPLGTGLIGGSAERGEFYERFFEPDAALINERHLRACVPLMMGRGAIGAIAIFDCHGRYIVKDPLDRDLFAVFARHAASALYWTGVYERARAALFANW
jgi:hypothetical protein